MAVSQGRDTSGKSQLPAGYAALHSQFRWEVPQHFNMAQVCSRRWAEMPDATKRIAIRAYSVGADSVFHTYFELQEQANRLSNALAAKGVQRGDRVGIVLPQRFETAAAYMAVLQLGAVAMPLSMLFGPEALEFRLQDSEAVVAICDAGSLPALASVRAQCPQLRAVLGVGLQDTDNPFLTGPLDARWETALQAHPAAFELVNTLAEEPAVLIYTSGTTGNPKGALIPHRALIGNLSGFVASQNWFGFDGKENASSEAVFWSPADWAWTGGAHGCALAHAVLRPPHRGL